MDKVIGTFVLKGWTLFGEHKNQTATMVADMWCILAELPYLKTWLGEAS